MTGAGLTSIPTKYLDMFCDYVGKSFGIHIEERQRKIFEIKLISLMQAANIEDASTYYHMIAAPPINPHQRAIQTTFLDTVTVHKTSFFREMHHFDFLKDNINGIVQASNNLKTRGELRVWSSASSTGEEPYSLAMLFSELGVNAKILGTDISPQSVQTGMNGVYKFAPDDYIPPTYLQKYFVPQGGSSQVVSDKIKNFVTFRLFNLMEPFPFKAPFDIIFCRNVMIYFNRDVQEELINKFYNCLMPGGLLFIGHSESLAQIKHNFTYTAPTIYKKL